MSLVAGGGKTADSGKSKETQADTGAGSPNADGAPGVSGLATTCLATIRPMPLRWLVPCRIPQGKLVMLAGDGGHGKSTVTLNIAACLSRGWKCFGLDYEPLAPCDVLLVSCEDDFGDTVVLRLLSASADLHRIHRVDGVKDKDGKALPFCLAHYQEMEEELEARPDVRLVVIDPAGAYIGRSGVDDHKDSDLRSLLGPLAELAARRNVTILIVKHFNRSFSAKAVHRVTGSAGYINTVRAAFAVVSDPKDDATKLLLPLKFNIGPKPAGLAFRLQALDRDTCNICLAGFDHLGPEDKNRLARLLHFS